MMYKLNRKNLHFTKKELTYYGRLLHDNSIESVQKEIYDKGMGCEYYPYTSLFYFDFYVMSSVLIVQGESEEVN